MPSLICLATASSLVEASERVSRCMLEWNGSKILTLQLSLQSFDLGLQLLLILLVNCDFFADFLRMGFLVQLCLILHFVYFGFDSGELLLEALDLALEGIFRSFEAVSLAGEGVSFHRRLIVELSVLLLDDSLILVVHLDTPFPVHLFICLQVRHLAIVIGAVGVVVSLEASDAVAWSKVAALDPDPKLMLTLTLEVSAQLNAGDELLSLAAAESKMLVFLLHMLVGVLRKDGLLVVSVNEIGRMWMRVLVLLDTGFVENIVRGGNEGTETIVMCMFAS